VVVGIAAVAAVVLAGQSFCGTAVADHLPMMTMMLLLLSDSMTERSADCTAVVAVDVAAVRPTDPPSTAEVAVAVVYSNWYSPAKQPSTGSSANTKNINKFITTSSPYGNAVAAAALVGQPVLSNAFIFLFLCLSLSLPRSLALSLSLSLALSRSLSLSLSLSKRSQNK